MSSNESLEERKKKIFEKRKEKKRKKERKKERKERKKVESSTCFSYRGQRDEKKARKI